jgi:hypothetical protein
MIIDINSNIDHLLEILSEVREEDKACEIYEGLNKMVMMKEALSKYRIMLTVINDIREMNEDMDDLKVIAYQEANEKRIRELQMNMEIVKREYEQLLTSI